GSARRAAGAADWVGGAQGGAPPADRRRPPALPGVEVVTLPPGARARRATLDAAIRDVDAVWVIAPETDRRLERLAARVERYGKRLLGSSAEAVARAAGKAWLPSPVA